MFYLGYFIMGNTKSFSWKFKMQEVMLDAKLVKLVPASPYLRSLCGSHLLIHILVAFQQSHGLRNYVKHNTFQQWE